MASLADDLQAVWSALTTDARLKRRIVRTVIREVIADIDADAGEILLMIIGPAAFTPSCVCPGGDAASATAPHLMSLPPSGIWF